MKEYEIIAYLLQEAKDRQKGIEDYEKKRERDIKKGTHDYYSEYRPTKALIVENMKKIRQLTLKIEGRV